MSGVVQGRDVRAMATEHIEEEARRLTRRTRWGMAVEGVLALLLGGAGVLAVLAAGTGTGTETGTVAGVRMGMPHFAVLAGVGFAILVTLRHPAWLRRVAVTKAGIAAAMLAAAGVYYPVGAWDLNLGGLLVPVVIALAGFVEFVLLGSANFATEPSDVPYRHEVR